MIAGEMKQSVVGQAGGFEIQATDMAAMNEKFMHAPTVDKEEAEMRMLSRIERLEKWNNQKKASKCVLAHMALHQMPVS